MIIEDINVITSGGFAEALKLLAPEFEKQFPFKVNISYGSSMGGAPDSIPARLNRNEMFDVIILASSALDDFIQNGLVKAGTRADLVTSVIGAVVKTGSPKPDIKTVESFKHTLLNASSIACSASASGTYILTYLFPKLGIANEMRAKTKKIFSERVGHVVARSDAEIGFQQVSELIAIPGVEFIGEIPSEVQHCTVFSAGIMSNASNLNASKDFIRFLASPIVAHLIKNTGLNPIIPILSW